MTVENCKKLLNHYSYLFNDALQPGSVKEAARRNYTNMVSNLSSSKNSERQALGSEYSKKGPYKAMLVEEAAEVADAEKAYNKELEAAAKLKKDAADAAVKAAELALKDAKVTSSLVKKPK